LGLMATKAVTMPSQAPRLYFEFRVNQESVDPLALVGSITNE
jgi:septal ring factor EnvC (AmiA/AmiB activator)